jgi:hypothetical protein
MKKQIIIYFADKRKFGSNSIYWDKADSKTLHRMLGIIKKHDPDLFNGFNFLEGDFEKQIAQVSSLMKTQSRITKSMIENERSSNERLQMKLNRPNAGRKKEEAEHIRLALSRSSTFEVFNEIFKKQTGHTVSLRTYQRYKVQFSKN